MPTSYASCCFKLLLHARNYGHFYKHYHALAVMLHVYKIICASFHSKNVITIAKHNLFAAYCTYIHICTNVCNNYYAYICIAIQLNYLSLYFYDHGNIYLWTRYQLVHCILLHMHERRSIIYVAIKVLTSYLHTYVHVCKIIIFYA